jgi:hypothetical protein
MLHSLPEIYELLHLNPALVSCIWRSGSKRNPVFTLTSARFIEVESIHVAGSVKYNVRNRTYVENAMAKLQLKLCAGISSFQHRWCEPK